MRDIRKSGMRNEMRYGDRGRYMVRCVFRNKRINIMIWNGSNHGGRRNSKSRNSACERNGLLSSKRKLGNILERKFHSIPGNFKPWFWPTPENRSQLGSSNKKAAPTGRHSNGHRSKAAPGFYQSVSHTNKTLILDIPSNYPQLTAKRFEDSTQGFQIILRQLTEAAMTDIALILSDDFHRNRKPFLTTIDVQKPSSYKRGFWHDFILQGSELSEKFLGKFGEKITEPKNFLLTAIVEGFFSS
ncbi:hypothetical protein SUGI_1097680 [Cryptomeria japonica]|nr:hypothetical protein SUGI_1097680 [Cryptomeria japonica]